jgi:hypothetical protein
MNQDLHVLAGYKRSKAIALHLKYMTRWQIEKYQKEAVNKP